MEFILHSQPLFPRRVKIKFAGFTVHLKFIEKLEKSSTNAQGGKRSLASVEFLIWLNKNRLRFSYV